MHHYITTEFVCGYECGWISSTTAESFSRKARKKGRKRRWMLSKQGGGFDSKITFANILCSFSRLAWQTETHLSVFNSLGKRGGVWSGKASSLTQTGKKFQKENTSRRKKTIQKQNLFWSHVGKVTRASHNPCGSLAMVSGTALPLPQGDVLGQACQGPLWTHIPSLTTGTAVWFLKWMQTRHTSACTNQRGRQAFKATITPKSH